MQRLTKNLIRIGQQNNKLNTQKLFQQYSFTKFPKFSFSISQNAKQESQSNQNRLKLVFVSATLGGMFIGFGLYTLINGDAPKNEQKKQKNNLFDFEGQWNQNWDNRQYLQDEEDELRKLKKENPDNQEIQNKPIRKRGIKYITLIRHGQYVYADDEESKKLTDLGRKQAEETGKRLKQLNCKFDKIYVSDMVRSKETCEIIQKQLKSTAPVIEDPLLAEGCPCNVSPPNKSISEIYKNVKTEKPEDQQRIEQAFEKYIHRIEDQEEDSHELYVIHGNVIRYIMTRALQFPAEGWLRFSTAHCGITFLQIRPSGNVSIRRFGESGHLKPEQVTIF